MLEGRGWSDRGCEGESKHHDHGDYDNFRLIVSTIQVKEPYNHQGIGFWGDAYAGRQIRLRRMRAGNAPDAVDMGLHVNKGAPGTLSLKRDWAQALGMVTGGNSREPFKGTIRMAVNGVEILDYRTAIRAG